MSEVFGDRTKQALQTRIPHRRRLVQQHGTLLLRRWRWIELVEKLPQRAIERTTGRDVLSGPCEGIGAHRSRYLRRKDILARSAACRHALRYSGKTRRGFRSPPRHWSR